MAFLLLSLNIGKVQQFDNHKLSFLHIPVKLYYEIVKNMRYRNFNTLYVIPKTFWISEGFELFR